MARVVGGVVGAVIGYYVGGPTGAQYGWAIGSTIGGAFEPNAQVQGPRLEDLRIPGTEYGQPIPYLLGHVRTSGQVWWTSEKREVATTTEEDGKGPGVETTAYTYEMDMLIGLTDNQAAGIARVWDNGKLIWTQLASATGTSLLASSDTDKWQRITFYSGASDQLPDPTMEAALGVGNTPAYRGRASVFIEGLQLGNSGQIPNLMFEVATLGTASGTAINTGVFPAADVWSRCSPIYVNSDGVQMHIKLWTSPYGPRDTGVFQLDRGGNVQQTAEYLTAIETPYVATGNSDESVAISNVLTDPLNTTYELIFSNGGAQDQFLVPELSVTPRFAFFAQRLYVTNQAASGAKQVYYFSQFGRALSATSPVLALAVQSLTMAGGVVYALALNSASLYVLDIDTLALLDTLTPPNAGTGNAAVMTDEHGVLYLATGTTLYNYIGGVWRVQGINLGAAAPTNQNSTTPLQQLAVFDNVLYAVNLDNTTIIANGGAPVFRSQPTFTVTDETVASAVSQLCLRAGLEASQFDVTDLAAITRPLRGLAVNNLGGTRAVLDLLGSAYFFSSVLSDKLYYRRRGSAPVVTIPYTDLGASLNPEGEPEPLALRPASDIEVPARIAVSYMNVDNDYQTDTQNSDRFFDGSPTIAPVQLPLALTAEEAKGIAISMVLDQAAAARGGGKICLLGNYTRLEPTDVVFATDEDGSLYRLRLVKRLDSWVRIEFEVVLDDASTLTSAGITSTDYTSSNIVNAVGATNLELMDIPILRDADNSSGIYAAANGTTPVWAGAAVMVSSNDNDFTEVARITESAVIGVASTTLGNWAGGGVLDEVNTLTVDVGEGQLTSTTRDTLLTDSIINSMLVGREVLRFQRAALIAPGIYTLSGFIRGARGTEWAMVGHVDAERVVLLRNAGLRRVDDQVGDVGISRFWKGVTIGRRLSTATSEAFTDTGVALKPFSPVDLRVSSDSASLGLTWKRRSRLATRFVGGGGINVPLGEDTEAYEVDVVRVASGLTLRTLHAAAQAVSYSAAEQASDNVTNADSIRFDVYQLSASVGRGYRASTLATGVRTARPQISTVTLGGTYASGVPLFVKIGATQVNYTSTVGDATLAGIATSLRAAIAAAFPTYTVTVLSQVITITGVSGVPFVLSAGVVGSGQLSVALVQTAAAQSTGASKQLQVALGATAGTFSALAGSTYSMRFERGIQGYGDRVVTYSYTASAGQSAQTVLNGLAGATPVTSDGQPAGITWNFAGGFGSPPNVVCPNGETQWTGAGTSSQPNAAFYVTVANAGAEVIPADRPQVIDYAVSLVMGTAITGHIFRITLDGTNYDYTVVGGNTYANVVTALVALIDAAAAFICVDSTGGGNTPRLRITAAVNLVPFTYTGLELAGSVSLATATTQQAS